MSKSQIVLALPLFTLVISSNVRVPLNFCAPNIIAIVIHKNDATPTLRPYKGSGRMRVCGSNADWFAVEFLIYFDRHLIRSFAYVRREDGGEIPDGDYEVLEGLDERRRRWKKFDGKWKAQWRHRWST